MSGLYNVIFGDGNEGLRGSLLGTMVGAMPEDFQRFRDAWVERKDDELRVAIYTRLGGGNRPDYQSVFEAMAKNPNYLFDRDDTYDSTYATFYFRLPTLTGEIQEVLEKSAREPVDMDARWKEELDRMQSEGPSPELMAKMAPVGEALKAAMDGSPMPDQSGSPIKIFGGGSAFGAMDSDK